MNRVITARTDPETARSYWTMSRTDSDRAFRAARRHSRLVRVLRVALPIAVVAALAVTVLITYLNPLRMLSSLPVNIDKLVVSGTKITMEKPRLAGFTHDARAYEMSAEAAQQDLTKPDLVELHNLHAKLQMQDKTMMTMSAADGLYNAKTQTLQLKKDILLFDKTYEGRLSEATIDISKGNVVSNAPVELKMLQGKLNANHLEVVDSGDLVRFTNGVTMDLKLSQPSSAQGKSQRQPRSLGSAVK
jgi:lipopolysaccharide export system protein LptC